MLRCTDMEDLRPKRICVQVHGIQVRRISRSSFPCYETIYETQRQKVIQSSGYTDGNAQRRWHGTTRTCRLGDSVSSTKILCRDSKCSLCRIIEVSDLIAYVTSFVLSLNGDVLAFHVRRILISKNSGEELGGDGLGEGSIRRLPHQR